MSNNIKVITEEEFKFIKRKLLNSGNNGREWYSFSGDEKKSILDIWKKELKSSVNLTIQIVDDIYTTVMIECGDQYSAYLNKFVNKPNKSANKDIEK